MRVLDASVVVEILLRTPTGARVLTQLTEESPTLCAPELIDVEVAQVLRRFASKKAITPGQGAQALRLLVEFPLTRHSHRSLLPRIWELRANVTAYDAAYLALGEMLGATVLTCDSKLARANGHRARIEVV